MNIFVVDECPYKAAQNLCDKHCVKMVLETTQILCTIANQKGYQSPYKSTHINHPAVKWTASHSNNWLWVLAHGFGLCAEYTTRYGKKHKCEDILIQLAKDSGGIWNTIINLQDYKQHTPFVQCIPEQYKTSNAIEAYRAYYINDKKELARWAYSERPSWFI